MVGGTASGPRDEGLEREVRAKGLTGRRSGIARGGLANGKSQLDQKLPGARRYEWLKEGSRHPLLVEKIQLAGMPSQTPSLGPRSFLLPTASPLPGYLQLGNRAK